MPSGVAKSWIAYDRGNPSNGRLKTFHAPSYTSEMSPNTSGEDPQAVPRTRNDFAARSPGLVGLSVRPGKRPAQVAADGSKKSSAAAKPRHLPPTK